jgi:hypothetical protein
MQSIEEFMREFLHSRCVEEQRQFASRTPFLAKYYGEEYRSNRSTYRLGMLQSEEIVSVTNLNSESVVVTVYRNPLYKPDNQMFRQRYHLMPSDNSWLIQFVEYECPLCSGLGDSSCTVCKGKHWCKTVPE